MKSAAGTPFVDIGETKAGKREASTHSLHLECIKACLDDAGIKASEVDGFISNQPLNDAHRSYPVRMANMARMSPTYATDLALGGVIPVAMVQNTVMAIEVGMAKTVMCVHARKRATPMRHSAARFVMATNSGRNLGAISRPSPITPSPRSADARLRHYQRRSRPCRGAVLVTSAERPVIFPSGRWRF